MGGTRHGRRVTMSEAADILGVSTEAVRKRVQRGTIETDKGRDGRRYVYLPDGRDGDQAATDHPTDRTAELISALREQVQAERQAHAETRRLLAAALERIPPQLEPPSEDAPETAPPRPGTPTPTEANGGPQAPAERVSWWRRMFGS